MTSLSIRSIQFLEKTLQEAILEYSESSQNNVLETCLSAVKIMSNNDLELIAAGFTAILGFKVVHGPAGQGLPKLTIRNLFHCTYIPRSLGSFSPEDVFDVHVKTITDATTTVQVAGAFTVAELKAAVK